MATLPIPGLMFTVLAPVTCQLSVAELPAVILAGAAEKTLMTGGVDCPPPVGCCPSLCGTVILKQLPDISITTTSTRGNNKYHLNFFITASCLFIRDTAYYKYYTSYL
jgi:hypothetical protein